MGERCNTACMHWCSPKPAFTPSRNCLYDSAIEHLTDYSDTACLDQSFPTPPVVTLFQNTRRHSNPVVVEAVALPCLTILKNLTGLSTQPPPVKEAEEAAVSAVMCSSGGV